MTWRIFTKYAKWFALAAAAVGAAVLTLLLRSIVTGRKQRVDLPELDSGIREAVRKAEEEALVARVEARVKAESEVRELETVSKIEDGVERRRRLAEMLNGV